MPSTSLPSPQNFAALPSPSASIIPSASPFAFSERPVSSPSLEMISSPSPAFCSLTAAVAAAATRGFGIINGDVNEEQPRWQAAPRRSPSSPHPGLSAEPPTPARPELLPLNFRLLSAVAVPWLLGLPPCPAPGRRVPARLCPPKRCFVIPQPSVTSAAHRAFHK